ncbi:hypothetical protein EMIT043CA1_150071 [Pseudomonas brassicacearum]
MALGSEKISSMLSVNILYKYYSLTTC